MTVTDYIDWVSTKITEKIASGRYLSTPTQLFTPDDCEPECWEFNPDNWNGGDILRRWLVDDWDSNTLYSDYQIKYYWDDDQTTIYILGDNEWFEISWYKSRGRTESIKRNGRYIELGDYIRLCNYLGVVLD